MADILNRNDLKRISEARLREAKILFTNNEFDGSVYLAGYALETALKARICKILQVNYPPNNSLSRAFFTHNIEDLVILAGLKSKFDALLSSNLNFRTNWSVLTDWSEQFRYKRIGTNSMQDAKDIIDALEDRNDGILTWLRKQW